MGLQAMKRESIRLAAAALFAALAAPAYALAPATVANFKINGQARDYRSFVEYRDLNDVDIGEADTNELFFIHEKTVDGVKSWFTFFDPTCKAAVQAEIMSSKSMTGLNAAFEELYKSDKIFGPDDDSFDYLNVSVLGLKSATTQCSAATR
jgi:hypothetical protein